MDTDKTIVRGRWLIPDAGHYLENGALLISGGQIVEVGSWEEVSRRHPDTAMLGGEDFAVIPGLINAHHHSNGVTALQQSIPDRLLELWLLSLAQRRSAGTYLATLLSAGRLLRTGVTAVVDVHSGRGSTASFLEGIQQALRAYDEAGMRVAFAAGVSEQSFLVWGEDREFLNSLPAELQTIAGSRLPAGDTLDIDDYFGVMDELQAAFQDHDRIAVWFGPPGPQWVTERTLQRMALRAEERNTGIQTHLLESFYEKLHGPRSYGRPTVSYLHELGVLSSRFSFAHGVWLTEAEMALLAAASAHVSHNPSSNLRLRAGIAPLNGLFAAGVNVALGMDGTTLNDDEDMFTEMRLALNLHRTPSLDGPAPTVEQVWGMATVGGARLFQAAGRLGKLEVGYAADVVLLRLDRLAWPWVAPDIDPRLLLLTRAQARDVDTVLIGGKVMLRDGRPTQFDEGAAGEAIARILRDAQISPEAIEVVRLLMPLVAAHYRSWPVPELKPFDARNSRS